MMYLNVEKKLNDAYLSCHQKGLISHSLWIYIYTHVLQDSWSLSKLWNMYHNFITHYFHLYTGPTKKNMSAAYSCSFPSQETKEAGRTATKGSLWTTGEGSRTQAWDGTRKGGETRAGACLSHDQKTIIHIIHIYIYIIYGIVTWNF